MCWRHSAVFIVSKLGNLTWTAVLKKWKFIGGTMHNSQNGIKCSVSYPVYREFYENWIPKLTSKSVNIML